MIRIVEHTQVGRILARKAARFTEAELIAWSKEQMAAYKYPRSIEFRDALPISGTGKVLKRELRGSH